VLGEEIPQIFAACGRGSRSSLRVLRPGLAVAELAVWQLPGQPTAVWTLRRSQQDDLDALIVVSFANATLVRISRVLCLRRPGADPASPCNFAGAGSRTSASSRVSRAS